MKSYPAETKQKAREMRRQGAELHDIAAACNVSHPTARAWCLDIPKPKTVMKRKKKS